MKMCNFSEVSFYKSMLQANGPAFLACLIQYFMASCIKMYLNALFLYIFNIA